MAKRSHPFPYRTRKLSSLAPMVVGGSPPVRVGRCQAKKEHPIWVLSVCRQKGSECDHSEPLFWFFIGFEAIIENSRPLRGHHLDYFWTLPSPVDHFL